MDKQITELIKQFTPKRCLGILFGNILITGAYAFITVPHEIINGGVTSFSMVLSQITGIDLSLFVNAITMALMIACWLFLGASYFTGSILSCACYLGLFTAFHALGLCVELPILACVVIAGILVGAGYYLCIHFESTTVGFDAIALMLNKRNPRINVALAMYAINVLVLLSGLVVYGFGSIVYGMLFTALQAGTLNVLLKIDRRVELDRC